MPFLHPFTFLMLCPNTSQENVECACLWPLVNLSHQHIARESSGLRLHSTQQHKYALCMLATLTRNIPEASEIWALPYFGHAVVVPMVSALEGSTVHFISSAFIATFSAELWEHHEFWSKQL